MGAGGVHPGQSIDNPALGLRSIILESSPEILRSEVEADDGANGGPLHRHMRQEERFLIEEGRVRVRLGLRGSRVFGAGEEAVIPIGAPHTFRVEGGPARFIAEFRPAGRIGEFFGELFALSTEGRLDARGNPRVTDLAVLMHRYPEDFFYPPLVPPAAQRALARPLARRAGGGVVRQPLSVGAAPQRRLEQRVAVRFPAAVRLATRAWLSLPPHSRLRQALLRRTVRMGMEAANRRDHEVAFATYDPGVELHVPPDLVAVGFDAVTRGRAERIRFEERWRDEWGDFEYAPQELRDLGDRVLVIGHMRGSGPSSGAAVDTDWAVLFTLSAGRVVREQVFLDHADALDRVGLEAASR